MRTVEGLRVVELGGFAHTPFARAPALDVEAAMARIAATNPANGAADPRARLRVPLDLAFCATASERNPRLAGRLHRGGCSPTSDGAAALVAAADGAAAAGITGVTLPVDGGWTAQ
jgi:acetyl-CoA acetyltransferase